MTRKIILDTDLGGDIDDAIALYMMLADSDTEILGIGSVYLGNEWRRSLIHEILDVFERKIPVCLGAERPLIGQWTNESLRPLKPQKNTEDYEPEDLTAAAQIIKLCTEHPDAVIFAIGPLTNIAVALSEAPWIAEEHKLVIMGGDPSSGRPEWNILCDPEAARIVLESGIDMHMVGLNCTNLCQFTEDDLAQIYQNESPRGKLMTRMLKEFMERFDWLPILHDPLAYAVFSDPDILRFEPHRVVVETRGEFTRGTTVDQSYDANSKIQLAVGVDARRFTEHVRDVLSKV